MAKFKGKVLKCGECGKEFKVPPVRANTAKYCSKECADVHRHDTTRMEKVERFCLQCGKVFYEHSCHIERRKYCSYVCANKAAEKVEKRLCAYCGEVFTVRPSESDICCSWKCRVARTKTEAWPTRKKVLRQCEQCGKEFWRSPSALLRGGGKFCSVQCRINSQKLDTFVSSSFYGSGLWLQLRKQALERDNCQCQICGFDGEKLHVHHIIFRRDEEVDIIENLITLCPSCHRKEHF